MGTDIVYGEDLIPWVIKAMNALSYKEGCQIIIVLNTIFPEVEQFLDEVRKTGKYCVRSIDAGEMNDMYYRISVFFIKKKKSVE